MNEYVQNERARAYFLTFTTYGTRLHGDERGTVDPHHNGYGDPHVSPRVGFKESQAALLKQPPFTMDADQRGAVADAIHEVCAYRGWELHALNVRTNHVHLMVSAVAPTETVLNTFKAYATRALRGRGLLDSDARVWTRHGSTRYLWDDAGMEGAAAYILDGQGPDLPRGTPNRTPNQRRDC